MKQIFFLVISVIVMGSSCKKEPDPVEEPNTDTSVPVIALNSPVESSVYHNGDTLFILGSVTDNSLHEGSITLIDDTSAVNYYSNDPYVHGLSNVAINFQYVVTGITQNSAVTLSVSYMDHKPNTGSVQRHLVFMP